MRFLTTISAAGQLSDRNLYREANFDVELPEALTLKR
jgi:hypothetical protein